MYLNVMKQPLRVTIARPFFSLQQVATAERERDVAREEARRAAEANSSCTST